MSIPKQQKSKGTSIKRRSLIKGTASAVPVVLTLRSGAAFATDSAAACVARTQAFLKANPGNKPEVLVEAANIGNDNWVRVVTTGRAIQLTEKDGNPVTAGKTLVVFRDPTYVQGDLSARWYETNTNTQGTIYFTEKLDANGASTNQMQNKDGSEIFSINSSVDDCNVLCLVDSDGLPINPPTYGDVFDDGEFPFATISCVNSINSII